MLAGWKRGNVISIQSYNRTSFLCGIVLIIEGFTVKLNTYKIAERCIGSERQCLLFPFGYTLSRSFNDLRRKLCGHCVFKRNLIFTIRIG